MLGLSQSVSSSSGAIERFPVVEYSSDFSSSTDGFSAFNDNTTPAATLTSGISFEGKTDVLRINWDAEDDNGLFFIKKSFPDLTNQDLLQPIIEFSADIYYDFTSVGELTTLCGAGSYASSGNLVVNQSVVQGEWVNISGKMKASSGTAFDEFLYIGFVDVEDVPVSGDDMYVANIVFTFEDKS